MIKQVLLLSFISISIIWNSANAQTYTIESFEGDKVKIHLTEILSPSWYEAAVSFFADTLILNDYNGIKEVHVLRHKFLEIVYDTPGGSGSQIRNTVILSVIRNKINVALLVNSFGRAFGGDIDGSLYLLKFNITGNNRSNFKLSANIYDRHTSNDHPKNSYIKNKRVILYFDPNQNIFYGTHKKITQSFTIDGSKVQSKKLEINEILPIIFLGKDKYYYIKDAWYRTDYDNHLFKDYYK